MNNKGFMMAEVVVVASIVLVTLVGFYTSYNKIISIYNQRIKYYDVTTLYKLANIRENHLSELTLNSTKTISGNNVYYVDKNKVKDKSINVSGLNQTFKDYLDYLSTSLDFNNMKVGSKGVTNILILENCITTDDCRYAYLEVPDDV